MNISEINSTSPNFNGKIITKGKITPYLQDEILNNKELQKLASGEKDILVRIKNKKERNYHVNHAKGEMLYRLSVESKKQNETLADKVKSFLGLTTKVNLSKAYHSEVSTASIIKKRINAKFLAKKLNIEV